MVFSAAALRAVGVVGVAMVVSVAAVGDEPAGEAAPNPSSATASTESTAPTTAAPAERGGPETSPPATRPLDAASIGLVSGQEAIDRLEAGAPLDLGSRRDGSQVTRAEVIETLGNDESLYLDGDRLVFIDPGVVDPADDHAASSNSLDAPPKPAFPLSEVAVSEADAANAFGLHSRPGSDKTIYLDFDGQAETEWCGFGCPHESVDLDGDLGSFSTFEREWIVRWWSRVAADYAMWDVDVTTEEPPLDRLTYNYYGDTTYGVRVVLTSTPFLPDVRGVAHLWSFQSGRDDVALVYVDPELNVYTEEYIPWVITHEVGHTLGLQHKNWWPPDAEKPGTFPGHKNWVPIMGGGRLSQTIEWPDWRDVVQWATGDHKYRFLNDQWDLDAISFYLTPLEDEHGPNPTPLESAAPVRGIINSSDDTDVFSIDAGAGPLQISAVQTRPGKQLDMSLTVQDESGAVVASQNSPGVGPESLTLDDVAPGTYLVTVDGVGYGDPQVDGYSDYSSVGEYEIVATFAAPRGDAAQPYRIDLDGDGITDVFTAAWDGDAYQWRYSSGGVQPWKEIGRSTEPLDRLRFGDFDGDGTTDVFSTTAEGDGYRWHFSPGGTGPWQDLGRFAEPVERLRLGDFDGDGITDIFTAVRDGSLYRWRYWSPRTRESTDLASSVEWLDRFRFGDFDGDGTTDVFTASPYGQWSYWKISWGGASAWTNLGWGPVPADRLRVGDFDGDHKTDLFTDVGPGFTSQWRYWSPLTRTWTDIPASKLGDRLTIRDLMFGDLDGDGTVDPFTVAATGTTSQWVYLPADSDWTTLAAQGHELLGQLRVSNPQD